MSESRAVTEPVFSLTTVAEKVECHPRTIMLYERLGLVTPFRDPQNRRLFSENNISRLRLIKYLIAETHIGLNGIRLLFTAIEIMIVNNVVITDMELHELAIRFRVTR